MGTYLFQFRRFFVTSSSFYFLFCCHYCLLFCEHYNKVCFLFQKSAGPEPLQEKGWNGKNPGSKLQKKIQNSFDVQKVESFIPTL